MAFGDIFYDNIAVFLALFLLIFVVFYYILTRTYFGQRRRNKGVVIIISFTCALLAAYGLYKKNFYFPFFDAEFRGFELSNLFAFILSFIEFIRSLGFVGAIISIIILALFLGFLYRFIQPFIKYLRVNWGI